MFCPLCILNHSQGLLATPSRPAVSNDWYKVVQNKESETVEIRITDTIGGWDGVSAEQLARQIKGLKSGTTINLYLYSGGGDVLEGNEIYNALAKHDGDIHVEIGALCASIATVVACAGKTVTMAQNGLYMIHKPWTWAMGDADDFTRIAGVMDKMEENIVQTYWTRAKVRDSLTPEKLKDLMREETWMTAQEALDNGFIDSILEKDDPEVENLRNRLDMRQFKNSAALLSRLPKEKQLPAASADDGSPSAPKVPVNNPRNKPTSKSESITDMYKKGKVSVFAAAMAAGMIPLPPRQVQVGRIHAGVLLMGRVRNDPPPVLEEVDQEKVKAEAIKLYKEKLKRDGEIDSITLKVRDRDKKDFTKLAAQAKQEDWTVDQFCKELATSDKFDAVGVVGSGEQGSGIEVVGVVGLPKGSPGEVFVSSEAYKSFFNQSGGFKKGDKVRRHEIAAMTAGFMANLGIQNVTTSAGLTSIEKLPGVVTLGVRPLMVKDLIAPGATNNTTIRYIRESSFTNAATTVGEGGTKPAASFALEEIDAPVRKIAAYTKVTDELWADYLAVASYINQRLPYMVERTEEDQLLNGDGMGNNLTGILNTAGIQTQMKAGDIAPDAIYKAFTKVRWGNLAGTAQGGFEPDGIVIHPTDWEGIRLLKDLNNQYFGGGPFTGAYGNGGLVQFESLWGKPVAVTPAITQGTALVGAFRLAAQYFQRQGMQIESTNTDQDDFIKNLITIRAELRLALAVYRALAFCQVTGL